MEPVHAVAHPRSLASSPIVAGNLSPPLLFTWDICVCSLWVQGEWKRGEGAEKILSHICFDPHVPSTHCLSNKVTGNAKNALPSPQQLLHRDRSGALQSLPSPLLCQLLSFPTLHNMHLQNNQSCDLLQATDSSLIFKRISEAGGLTLYQNEKRVGVEKVFSKRNALSLPYCTWDARKGSLQRGKKKGSILCSTDACSRWDSDWHWPFQLFQK